MGVELVGSYDKSDFGVAVEPVGVDFLVGRPAAAGHHDSGGILFSTARECLEFRYLLSHGANLRHAVETCVAAYLHIVYVYAFQKLAASAVLHEDAGVPFEPHAVPRSAVTEEVLVRTECRADKICRDASRVELVQIVAPYLVFDEYGHFGPHRVDKSSYSRRGVEGQIAHAVCSFVMVPHLIARR